MIRNVIVSYETIIGLHIKIFYFSVKIHSKILCYLNMYNISYLHNKLILLCF